MKEAESASRALWLDSLRATVTLLVVAHHSSLAYTTFARFDPLRYLASTAPIVDNARWGFLDYAENFNDVFFMSLMFFISGLLVLPAIIRHGRLGYLRGRAKRLGAVFIAAVALLMPLAYYPSYLQTGGEMGYLEYWLRSFPRDGLSPGPAWFLWLLLLFDAIAAFAFPALKALSNRCSRALASWKDRPTKAFAAIFVVAILAYIPMIARFGEHTWTYLVTPPFYFQTGRLLLYFAWFAFGALVGAKGTELGLLAREGRLARRWPLWVAVCILAYNLLWFLPGHSHFGSFYPSELAQGLLYVGLWLLSNCASCFGFLAAFRALATRRTAWMASLSHSAYAIFVLHYVFLTWIQTALLGAEIPAAVKFLVTFALTLGLSWLTAIAIGAVRSRLRSARPLAGASDGGS